MSLPMQFHATHAINKLRWARKMLMIAAIAQVPLLLALLLPLVLSQKLVVGAFLLGDILAWLGFSVTDRQLGLFYGVLENLPGNLIESRWVRSRTALLFYVVLLAPFCNLLIIAWSYVRAGEGIRDIKRLSKDLQEKEKRAANLRGGAAQAFRTDC